MHRHRRTKPCSNTRKQKKVKQRCILRKVKVTIKAKAKAKTARAQRMKTMRGGNYQTDITTRTLENMPMKPLNKVVVTVPGRGTMSASAYVQLMEDLDRNGDHYYD